MGFHTLGILNSEVAVDAAQFLEDFVSCQFHPSERHAQAGELRQRQFCQSDEILHLYLHTVADKGEFRKIIVKTGCFAAIAAVNGGNSC